MSTIPLSMREGYGLTLSSGDAPVAARDDDSSLDALIENITETITHRGVPAGAGDEVLLDEAAVGDSSDTAGGGAGDTSSDTWRDLKEKLDDPETAGERGPVSELDHALKVAVDRRAGQEAESSDFHQSREWRVALEQRYDGRIAIGELLDIFADWHERLKQDPGRAADAIAAAYFVTWLQQTVRR